MVYEFQSKKTLLNFAEFDDVTLIIHLLIIIWVRN